MADEPKPEETQQDPEANWNKLRELVKGAVREERDEWEQKKSETPSDANSDSGKKDPTPKKKSWLEKVITG